MAIIGRVTDMRGTRRITRSSPSCISLPLRTKLYMRLGNLADLPQSHEKHVRQTCLSAKSERA